MDFGQNIFHLGQYKVSGRSSGSEGMELALRIVFEQLLDQRSFRRIKNSEHKRIILSFEGAWHGWTMLNTMLNNRAFFKVGLPEVTAKNFPIRFEQIPFGDTQLLIEYFAQKGSEILAVVVEPIQGDAGIIVPEIGYLRTLAELSKQSGAFLIADEILTFAKTGKYFAMYDEQGPIATDITVIGKYLGMGLIPVSFVIAREDFRVRACATVSTYDLRPTTCSVIKRGIEYIEEQGLLEKTEELGKWLRAEIHSKLVVQFPSLYRCVRGMGFLNGIELMQYSSMYVDRIRNTMIECGVYLEVMSGAGKRSHGLRYLYPALRIAPALIISQEELQEAVEAMVLASKQLLQQNQVLQKTINV